MEYEEDKEYKNKIRANLIKIKKEKSWFSQDEVFKSFGATQEIKIIWRKALKVDLWI